jgi:hypothetical protein
VSGPGAAETASLLPPARAMRGDEPGEAHDARLIKKELGRQALTGRLDLS